MLSAIRAARWLTLAVALAVVPAIGCQNTTTTAAKTETSSKVTEDNYKKIKTDMTKKEVEDILGKGETKTGIKIGDNTGDGVVYKGEKGDVQVIYKDDKVVAAHWAGK
jgi:hypothetical protein